MITHVPRSDALPERWILNGVRAPCGHLAPCGCRHWHGCCGACPLPICVKDGTTSRESRAISQIPRNNAIIAARATGATIAELTQEYKLGERAVFSVLAQARRVE